MLPHVKILIAATVLLICGAAFPFLMIIGLMPTTFLLSFISYGASVAGLVLGMYGVTTMVIRRRERQEWEDWRDKNGY